MSHRGKSRASYDHYGRLSGESADAAQRAPYRFRERATFCNSSSSMCRSPSLK
jgi:hypothetical protein